MAYYRSTTIGPVPCGPGQVWLKYGHVHGQLGFPPVAAADLRAELANLGTVSAPDADAAAELFAHFATYADPSWMQYGGRYWLQALHLHIPDTGTRYSIELPASGTGRIMLPTTEEPR